MSLHIYILAGSGEEKWCEELGIPFKALLPWKGKTIIQTMVDNIRKDIDIPITVMGHERWPDTYRIEGAHLVKVNSTDLLETVKAIKPRGQYNLLLTGDSPLVKGNDLLPIIENPADITAGVIYKQDMERMFPGLHKTFIPLKEGKIKLAGATLINKDVWDKAIEEGSRYYYYRKSPAKIVWKLGISLFAKLITGNLTINDVIKWVDEKFGVRGNVVTVSPTLGADVDDKEDYLLLKLIDTLRREET